MENIVVVDAVSTGYNLVEDVIHYGYHPVVINMTSFGSVWLEKNKTFRPMLEGKCDFIDEQPVYEDTLRMVKDVRPKVVLAGSEAGVELATKLAEDLHLPGNPTSILPQMKEKAAMHEAVRKYGIRSIRGKIIHNVEEAAEFYDELGVKRVVVKLNMGDASVGVRICSSKAQTVQAVKDAFQTGIDHYDRPLKVMLIQEMIEGTEYIVNVAVCNGRIRLTSVYRYKKQEYPDGRKIYRYTESINELGVEQIELIRYAYSVVKAIGIKYGCVHGEFMVDEKGPVLIEVNCRPMGGGMHADFADLLNGQHETDSHLMCYLDPEKFAEEARKPYRTNCKLVLKHMMSTADQDLYSSPILAIAPHLKSYHNATLKNVAIGHLTKTADLSTEVGTIYLAHPDTRVIMRETELLCLMEDSYPEMLYQDKPIPDMQPPEKDSRTGLAEIADVLGFGDRYTVIDMDENKGQKIVNKPDYYDNVILDSTLNSWTVEDSIGFVFDLVKSMKKGSSLVITSKLHNMYKLGIERCVAAMQFAGLTIEAPLPDYPDLLIGTV